MELTELQKTLRKNVVEELRFLTSAEAQLNFQRDVPFINATVEIFCQWAHDAYVPDSEHFRAAFSAVELTALADFNQVFEEVSDALPDESLPPIEDFLRTPAWARLAEAAAVTLQVFEPNK